MSAVFLKLLNMSISAGWLVLAVLLLRIVLKKAPKSVCCVLWAFVGVRLICPISPESVLSLIPSAETVPQEFLYSETPTIHSGVYALNHAVNPILSQSLAPASDTAADIAANPAQTVTSIAAVVWILGASAMLLWAAISYFQLHRRVAAAMKLRDNLWLCDQVDSPFILGILRPRVYLPSSLSEEQIASIAAHENAHLCRRDHLWKPLGFLLLAVYWFNPLMWLAYALLCRDIELACDERVIRKMDTAQKKQYSETLLSCSISSHKITACPLAFGEVGVKERIKAVRNYRKPALGAMIAAAVLCVIAAVCFLTNPVSPVSVDEDLDSFLTLTILKTNRSRDIGSTFACESHEILGVTTHGDETTVYAAVLYQEYRMTNAELVMESASHVPAAITVTLDSQGNYSLAEYWIPRDGTYYPRDLRAKFPWYLWGKLDLQDYIADQQLACDTKAKQYLSQTALSSGELNGEYAGVPANSPLYYRYYSSPDVTEPLASLKDPALVLFPEDGTFQFTWSLLSSYLPFGDYTLSGNTLTLRTSDGAYFYTFRVDGQDLLFDASNSSAIPVYRESADAKPASPVPDGARFTLSEPNTSFYFFDGSPYQSIIGDIDGDEKDERCSLGRGPTSGLFTFTITVTEGETVEYFNVFTSPFYYLAFVRDETGQIWLQGETQDDPPEIHLFEMTIEEGNIVLTRDGERLDSDAEHLTY